MINPPKNAPKNVIFSQKRKFGDFSSFLGKFLGTQKRVNHGLYRHFVNLPKNRIWEIFYVTVQIDFLFFLRFCAKIFCTFEHRIFPDEIHVSSAFTPSKNPHFKGKNKGTESSITLNLVPFLKY